MPDMTVLGRPLRQRLRDWMQSIRRYGAIYLAAYLFDLVRIRRAEAAEGFDARWELHQVAECNIRRYRSASQRCASVVLHCMNALEYDFEAEPLVLFLANPFGRDSIESVVARLEISLHATPRQAYVIYVNPRFEASLRGAGFLRGVKRGGAWWRPWSRYVVYESLPGSMTGVSSASTKPPTDL